MRSLFASVAVLLLAAAPAIAAGGVNVPPFSSIEARGGSHVILHHGATQHVAIIKGDMNVSRVSVVSGKLVIDPCPNTCWFWSHHELEVDVVAPNVDALEAHGGADIDARGPFPRQAQMHAEAHGGGDIDIRAIPVEHVTALAHGGGDVKVQALSSLDAEAHGGGDITYVGHPAKINSKVHGGGNVSQE